MKVRQMLSRSGKPVANHFIISDGDYDYFQSYESIIAKINTDTGFVTLDELYWNHSTTTGKYRNQFLDEDSSVTKAKIKSGDYQLANLNW